MDIKKLQHKEQEINNCIKVLKQEFIGIDSIIDQVMNNIKPWYMFPELNERPVVINLWGMTGCGKTSLVNRICELLDFSSGVMYYNLAKLGEDNSNDIEDEFRTTIGYTKKNPVFIFDEFQFAASLEPNGKEKEIKTSLKTIWEIIDSGKIKRSSDIDTKRTLERIINAIEVFDACGGIIKDGVWVNAEECMKNLPTSTKAELYRFFNVDGEVPESYSDFVTQRYWSDFLDRSFTNDTSFYISCETGVRIYDILGTLGDISCAYEVYKNDVLNKMSMTDLYDTVKKLSKRLGKGYNIDYSQALVFVMGNIDEAYEMSYNVDPDMDPDQFKIATEKLSAIDVKEALHERFRNEQIARLGSIMILYPSFSKDEFKKIIEIELQKYAKSVKGDIDIDIEFDDSIKELIYNDGVFPAQGTRPVFTSIYEIAKTKLAYVITECINQNIFDLSKIYMRCECNDILIEVNTSTSKTLSMKYEQPLRVISQRQRTNKEQQIITAVHESGHFVMYSKLTGKLPAKLMSVTASSHTNGFMLPDNTDDEYCLTKKDYLDKIMVSLGGYAAEKILFGDDEITSGASSDLEKATTLASDMVRNFGMSTFGVEVTTYLKDAMSTCGGGLILNSEKELERTNMEIHSIIQWCLAQVLKTLKESCWRKMFVESMEYLSEHSSMPVEKMKEIYDKMPDDEKSDRINRTVWLSNKLQDFIKQ